MYFGRDNSLWLARTGIKENNGKAARGEDERIITAATTIRRVRLRMTAAYMAFRLFAVNVKFSRVS